MAASTGGLIPHNRLGGTPNSSGTQKFWIAASESADFFQGDLCLLTADGDLAPSTAIDDERTVGVFQGCQYEDANGVPTFTNYYNSTIASEGMIAHVITDPFQLYRIRIANGDEDDTLTREAIGLNYDIEYNTASTVSGMSGMCLDSGTTGATGAAQLKLVDLVNVDGSDSPTTATSSTTYTHGVVMLMPSISMWLADTGI